MKRSLTIVIDSGTTTCASSPGVFCPWVRTARLGSVYQCGLFDHAELTADDKGLGWLQRLPACIAAEGEEA